MNKFISAIILMFCQLTYSQEKHINQFEVSFAYGMAYHNLWWNSPGHEMLNLELSRIGHAFEFSFDFRLPHNRFIGLSYARQEVSTNLDDSYIIENYNVVILLENYRNSEVRDFFGIDFRKEFNTKLHLSVGLFYYFYYSNLLRRSYQEPYFYIIWANEKSRLDDLGIWLALDYYRPVRDYFNIGIRSRGFFTLSGFETITLTPVLKFSF